MGAFKKEKQKSKTAYIKSVKLFFSFENQRYIKGLSISSHLIDFFSYINHLSFIV